MSDTAAAQLRRVLHLIPQLADDRDHPIEEVARRVGVDRRTLERDLYSISERFDEPAGFVEGVTIAIENGQVSVHGSHFQRPMRLTLAELGALELGLAMLRGERPPEEHRAIDGARERLRSVITRLPDEPLDHEARTATLGEADRAVLARLRAAFRHRRKLRVAYHKAAEPAAANRVVCPYGLVFASGTWYLVAHCERSGDLRFFRLDRIEGVEELPQKYEVPADFSAAEVVRGGRLFETGQPATVRVRYSPRIARWIAEREGAPLAGDGSLTLEHPLADLDWAVRHVLQYGPDAEVLEPPAVREAVRARLAAMLAG